MERLPMELLVDVLSLAICSTNPINILCISSLFRDITQEILHRDLHFYSSAQLTRFAELISSGTLRLACEPQTLVLDIAGGASFGIFEGLHAVVTQLVTDARCKTDENGNLVLETLRLRLHSLKHDEQRIYTSLSKANARRFIWTGPDPPHHFSTAIVSPAVFPLFRALALHTRLTYLHLTNVAFPDPTVTPDPRWTGIPHLSSLRSFYLGKVTFLTAESVARFLMRCWRQREQSATTSHSTALEHFQLVDAYEESIWGPRLRMPRIMTATKLLMESEKDLSNELQTALLEMIEKLVTVVAKTERIMGGDRVAPEASTTTVLASI